MTTTLGSLRFAQRASQIYSYDARWLDEHMENWIKKHAPIEYSERDSTRERMTEFLMSLPDDESTEWLDRGWPTIFDHVFKA